MKFSFFAVSLMCLANQSYGASCTSEQLEAKILKDLKDSIGTSRVISINDVRTAAYQERRGNQPESSVVMYTYEETSYSLLTNKPHTYSMIGYAAYTTKSCKLISHMATLSAAKEL